MDLELQRLGGPDAAPARDGIKTGNSGAFAERGVPNGILWAHPRSLNAAGFTGCSRWLAVARLRAA
jgi:hypothetical protein